MSKGDDATRASGMDAVMIYTTFPNETKAAEVAEILVRGRMAACANILPGARSIYMWQGKLEQESEVVVIFKTAASRSGQAMDVLRQHHPYDNPALLVYRSIAVSPDYLAWINEHIEQRSE